MKSTLGLLNLFNEQKIYLNGYETALHSKAFVHLNNLSAPLLGFCKIYTNSKKNCCEAIFFLLITAS